jgi:serine/threonine protein kinase
MHDLKSKTLIDSRFEVIERIGAGGMGIVYKAQQVGFDRIVALKVLLPQLLMEPQSVSRFELEAQALAALSHRNISLFYAYGVWQGRAPYIAMEYIDAPDMAALLIQQGGTLPWKRTLSIVRQIAEGVACAHKAGIIHRDLKPSNVCVLSDESGEDLVKVMDFGLAKFIDEDGLARQKLTRTGVTVGSPLFMSPEQVQGMPATPASDIYSIGCIMYQSLFGRPPHNADNMFDALAEKMYTEIPLPKAEEIKYYPPQIVRVLEVALARDPADRYKTVSDFVDAIAEIESNSAKLRDAKIHWVGKSRANVGGNSLRGISRGRIAISISLVALSLTLLIVAFNQPLLEIIAGQITRSNDTKSMENALAAARSFESISAYSQSASFYDAALSASRASSDAWQTTEIALAEAAMLKKCKMEDRRQAALGEIETTFAAALKCDRFLRQRKDVQRQFVVACLMAISEWKPKQPLDAAEVNFIPANLEQMGFEDEAALARTVWLLFEKPIRHPVEYMHTTMTAAFDLIENGLDAPYAKDKWRFSQSAIEGTHGDSEAAKRLLPIVSRLCRGPKNVIDLNKLLQAVYALQEETENRDDLEVVSSCDHALFDFVSKQNVKERMHFYRHAIAAQTKLRYWGVAQYFDWFEYESALANELLEQQQPEQAIALYEAGVKAGTNDQFRLDPKDLDEFVENNKMGIAEILEKQARWTEAEVLLKPLKLANRGFVHYLQANAIAHTRGLDAALKEMQPVPELPVMCATGRFDLAVAAVSRWKADTKVFDEKQSATLTLAEYAAATGDKNLALSYIKEVLEQTKSLPLEQKDIKLARQYLEYGRALALCERFDEAKVALAESLKYAQAAGDAATDISVSANYELGNLLLDSGDYVQAAKHFSDSEYGAEQLKWTKNVPYRCTLTAHAFANKDLSAAHREAARAAHEVNGVTNWMECVALVWQAEVYLAEGEREPAKRNVRQAMAHMKMAVRIVPTWALCRDYAHTLRLAKKLGISN